MRILKREATAAAYLNRYINDSIESQTLLIGASISRTSAQHHLTLYLITLSELSIRLRAENQTAETVEEHTADKICMYRNAFLQGDRPITSPSLPATIPRVSH